VPTDPLSNHLLCIVDGTPASDAALVAAIELADERHAALTVATCTPPARLQCSCRFPASKWDQLMRERCAADLERAAEVVASRDGRATLVVLESSGARAIARAAEARGCDTMVVAAPRGRWSSLPRALRRYGSAAVVAVDPRLTARQSVPPSPPGGDVAPTSAFRP
jgi:nucleotide-binding universal stress UspA family protein